MSVIDDDEHGSRRCPGAEKIVERRIDTEPVSCAGASAKLQRRGDERRLSVRKHADVVDEWRTQLAQPVEREARRRFLRRLHGEPAYLVRVQPPRRARALPHPGVPANDHRVACAGRRLASANALSAPAPGSAPFQQLVMITWSSSACRNIFYIIGVIVVIVIVLKVLGLF